MSVQATFTIVFVPVTIKGGIAGKIGVAQIPPILMVALRFTLVTILLFPFLRRRGPRFWPVAARVKPSTRSCGSAATAAAS